MMKCRKCKHLISPEEPHECPTAEYTQARDALISDAAVAQEVFSMDELEEHALGRPVLTID